MEQANLSHSGPNTRLAGQVAIVTGASQGIGEAIALRLAQMGVHLMLCARNEQKLLALSLKILEAYPTVRCLLRPCDAQDATQVEAVVQATIHQLGQVDILINNAGVAPHVGLFQEVSLEEIERTIDTNLKGCMYFMRAVIPHMVERHTGAIVNINSIAGLTAYPYWSVYDASKFGLRALTEAVAQEQRSNHIKVIGIYPGAVDTLIWKSTQLTEPPPKEGMLQASHVADAVAYVLGQPPEVFIKELVLEPLKPLL